MTRKKNKKKGSVMLILIVCGASSVTISQLANSTQFGTSCVTPVEVGSTSGLSGRRHVVICKGTRETQMIRDERIDIEPQNFHGNSQAALRGRRLYGFWNMRETEPGSTGCRNFMVPNGGHRFHGPETERTKNEGWREEKIGPYHDECQLGTRGSIRIIGLIGTVVVHPRVSSCERLVLGLAGQESPSRAPADSLWTAYSGFCNLVHKWKCRRGLDLDRVSTVWWIEACFKTA